MIVHANSQFVAAFQPAAFEHLAAIRRRHAGAKPVDAEPVVNFWLIRAFRHALSFRCQKLRLQ